MSRNMSLSLHLVRLTHLCLGQLYHRMKNTFQIYKTWYISSNNTLWIQNIFPFVNYFNASLLHWQFWEIVTFSFSKAIIFGFLLILKGGGKVMPCFKVLYGLLCLLKIDHKLIYQIKVKQMKYCFVQYFPLYNYIVLKEDVAKVEVVVHKFL